MRNLWFYTEGQRISSTHWVCVGTYWHIGKQCRGHVLHHDEKLKRRPVGETDRSQLQGELVSIRTLVHFPVFQCVAWEAWEADGSSNFNSIELVYI